MIVKIEGLNSCLDLEDDQLHNIIVKSKTNYNFIFKNVFYQSSSYTGNYINFYFNDRAINIDKDVLLCINPYEYLFDSKILQSKLMNFIKKCDLTFIEEDVIRIEEKIRENFLLTTSSIVFSHINLIDFIKCMKPELDMSSLDTAFDILEFLVKQNIDLNIFKYIIAFNLDNFISEKELEMLLKLCKVYKITIINFTSNDIDLFENKHIIDQDGCLLC